jgi:hypothetical protein
MDIRSSLRISTASCCRNQKAACAGPPKARLLEHSAIYRSTFCRFAEDWSIKRRHDFHPRDAARGHPTAISIMEPQ